MQRIGEDIIIGAIEYYNNIVTIEDHNMGTIEDHNMGTIEVNSIVAAEGDRSVGFYSLLIVGELSRGLRRASAAADLLGLQVRIPPGQEFLL